MGDWHLRDLFVDHATGRLRESKLWSNVGKAAMTWAFCYAVYKGQNTDWLWTAYGVPVLGHEFVTRMLNQKERVPNANQPTA